MSERKPNLFLFVILLLSMDSKRKKKQNQNILFVNFSQNINTIKYIVKIKSILNLILIHIF